MNSSSIDYQNIFIYNTILNNLGQKWSSKCIFPTVILFLDIIKIYSQMHNTWVWSCKKFMYPNNKSYSYASLLCSTLYLLYISAQLKWLSFVCKTVILVDATSNLKFKRHLIYSKFLSLQTYNSWIEELILMLLVI